MSCAAVLGGTCTLIGTGSKPVVRRFLLGRRLKEFFFVGLALVGIPMRIVGVPLLSFVLDRLPPDGWRVFDVPEK